ncbi:hypothetical protein V8C86DRAFT_2524011 [Haematococcus lacustris]
MLVHPPLPLPPLPAPLPARVKANVDEAAEALRRQEGQESAHPACEVFAVAQQLHLTTASAWEVVQPIFLEARRYYCHRMSFLDMMPYRFAQLGDTDSTARQRAAWAVLGHFSCGGMDMFERPPSKELVGDLLVGDFGKASPSLATAHPSPVAAAATPSPTAATSTSVCKRSVGSITVSLASLEARSACGQTATMQQEEAKQYAADKATDKGRHLQAVALYRCKLACNKLPPTTSKLLKNQLQELWAVVGNGQPTVKPVRNMHIVDWLDALAVHMSPVTN